MNGTLYIVSTPIGDEDDITYRALRILKEADLILFEEKKTARQFFTRHKLNDKRHESINEHNEDEISDVIVQYLRDGENIALISDAGTPVFSDPGWILVDKAIKSGIKIVPVPGPSSIVPALVLSGFYINEFVFYGFLSPKAGERKAELRRLLNEPRTIVIMDTPYRLIPLLRDLGEVFVRERRIAVAFNLTMEGEQVFRGWANELFEYFNRIKLKGEFVIVIEGMR